MQTLIVTGRISGKKYALPVKDLGIMSQEDYGTRIEVKNNKIKYLECIESLQELTQTLAAME